MSGTWYRGRDGSERFWLDADEIEAVLEEELRRAALLPSLDNAQVDFEAFIYQHLGARRGKVRRCGIE